MTDKIVTIKQRSDMVCIHIGDERNGTGTALTAKEAVQLSHDLIMAAAATLSINMKDEQ